MSHFIHLRTHTEYSIIDGLLRIESMVEQAVQYKMPALAITDYCNFFALVKFYQQCISAGIKPIIGAEVTIYDQNLNSESLSRLILIVKDNHGYNNLTKLISRSYLERSAEKIKNNELGLGPVIRFEWLTENNYALSQGLIALSAGVDGSVAQLLLNNKPNDAKDKLNQYKNIFHDRFYIEINRNNKPHESQYISLILSLAAELNLPVVATNNAVFLNQSDYEAHEARVCINRGYVLADPSRPKNYTVEQYFKSQDEMKKLFADLPGAISNTYEIAKRCTMELTLDKHFLPNFPIPNNLSIEAYLSLQSNNGLNNRLNLILKDKSFETDKSKSEYLKQLTDRLETELSVINNMGFAGYFLIVADFIAWAKNNGVPVGPGRGSGAGSLVAYVLGITDLNPLDYDLLFERFLNPERVSMPDFDIDFCMEGRDRVIEYVSNKYGRNSVSQIITFGTMAAKAVVRDVGRVLGYPYGFVDRIAKMIPFELGMTLDRALEQEPLFLASYEEEEGVKEFIDLARKLEGVARNVGKHAGGVVIAPGDLTNFTALYCEEGGASLVSQFDKDDVEAIGLVKFDFLGLRTLTIINWAVSTINNLNITNDKINIELINLDDHKTFSLLKSCHTTAVFQLESSGMKDLIKRLQPDCFEDIIALVALFRPGPLQSGMVDDFIDRKHGRAKVEYPHKDLEPILKHTYGVILYQEQVMQIAQVLAGYSLGAADLLRRAMGKKKPEEMAKQREIFVTGALKNHIDEKTATYIFDLMEKFAGYGFNKSHSAAYALVSYQTAWLKAHHKEAFMAAVLSSDMDNTDKVLMFYEDAISLGITVLKPDVNMGSYKFVCSNNLDIIYGLGAIKGLGYAAIENIILERNQNGIYKDLFDFCCRVDLRKVNRRALEALVKSGAFDQLGESRPILFANIDNAVHYAEQVAKNSVSGQNDLFGLNAANLDNVAWLPAKPWSSQYKLQAERDTLGIFMSSHPLDAFKQELKELSLTLIRNLKPGTHSAVIAGVVIGVRKVKTKSGERLVILTLDDKSARLDITLYGNEADRYHDLIVKDKVLVAVGRVSEDRFTGGVRLQANQLMDIIQAKITKANVVRLILTDNLVQQNDLLLKISALLAEYSPGNCNLLIEYKNKDGRAIVAPNKKWQFTLTQNLLDRLYQIIPEDNVSLQYHPSTKVKELD